MLNVLTTKQIDNNNKKCKEAQGNFWRWQIGLVMVTVMVSLVCAYVQIHQIVYINYVQFFVYQLYLNKVLNKWQTSNYYWLKLNHV